MPSPAILILEDEEPFHGVAMGHEGVAGGVMALSALAAGFSDLITDPFYSGKLVCFTYPHVGNAGVVPQDFQSGGVAARAVIAREFSRFKANRLGVETMNEFLKKNHIPAIEDVDTRTIAEIVSRRGAVRAILGCGRYAALDSLMKAFEKDDHWDAEPVGTTEPYEWQDASTGSCRYRVVVVDLGVKKGFLRRLSGMGCEADVVPASWPAEKIMGEKPDGVVFSSGPGVPGYRPEAVATAGELLGLVPVWGVGIGAGILAAAAGATIIVNGRGHMGCHPVGRVGGTSGEMTMQCHEFWVEGESLAGAGFTPTHYHLNDGTLQGFKCDKRRAMGILFHPESEPGPRDSLYMFDRFYEMMRKYDSVRIR